MKAANDTIVDDNVMLDKFEAIRWAKSRGLKLPQWCWDQLKEHEDKIATELKNDKE